MVQGVKGSRLACLGHGFKGSSDPPQNRRIKMLKNYKEQKDLEKDRIETP